MEIIWRDASLDTDSDGPVGSGGGLREELGTIGYLVNKTRGTVVLASDFDYEDSSARTLHTIPRSQIKYIDTLPRVGALNKDKK